MKVNKKYGIALAFQLVASVAQARLVDAWCGGGIFSVDKKTGSQLAAIQIPDMQLVGIPSGGFAISGDRKVIRISYSKCLPNNDKNISAAWKPAHANVWSETSPAEFTTATWTTDSLQSTSTRNSTTWATPLEASSQDPDGRIVVHERELQFNDDSGQLCLLKQHSRNPDWCYTIDPYSRNLRAGPSLGINVHALPEGYLVVTDWFGAFLLDRSTGFSKWHIPFSNMDWIPAIADAGDRWIFFPLQLEDHGTPSP